MTHNEPLGLIVVAAFVGVVVFGAVVVFVVTMGLHILDWMDGDLDDE